MDQLTQQQLTELEQKLRSIKIELEARLVSGQEGGQTVTLDQSRVGRLSRMDAMQQQAMAQAENQQAALKLKQVEQALAKMESGDYGYCKTCDELISFKRLSIKPETSLCISCQEKLEARQ